MAKVAASMNTPLPTLRLYQSTRQVALFAMMVRDADIDLNPPYQRGDVWGLKRRQNLIKSLLIGVPIPSIVLNDRHRAEYKGRNSRQYAVIDGKQRITTILMFMGGALCVPGEWFPRDHKPLDLEYVSFNELSQLGQRNFKGITIQVAEAVIDTLEGEREVFDLINFGGLRQGEIDSDAR